MTGEQPPEEQKPHSSVAERGIALAFATAVLITLIVLVLNPRPMDGGVLAIIRFLAATFAGVAGYLFTGSLGLEASIPLNKTQIRATGAFAAFIAVLILFFLGVPSSTSQSSQNPYVSNLCKELENKSIAFNGNNYWGVVAPTGIKLQGLQSGEFIFETEVVFNDKRVIQDFGRPLVNQIVGVCQNKNSIITINRTLDDGTIQYYTGHIYKAEDTGRTELEGTFRDGGTEYSWSGWITIPSKQ